VKYKSSDLVLLDYPVKRPSNLLTSPTSKACFDTVALNAGAVLFVSGLAGSIAEGFDKACACMRSGIAMNKLELWSQVAQELMSRGKKQKS
jgi:hypothetical protein